MKTFANCIYILISFFSFQANAQSFIALSTGISTDLNNARPFYTVPVTLRWEPFKHSSFFIESIQGTCFTRLSKADAFTTSSQLSEHVVLTEATNLNIQSIGVGGAIVLYTNKKNNRFTLNLSMGICTELFKVKYRNYDMANYEVLNPDVNTRFSGLYASIAGTYNFHKRKQDMFLMMRVQSPSSASGPDHYSLSFHKTAPLELSFGYKLFYNKK
ncbi:MAG: hypothetical protein ABI359_10265 [Ginsengibacter sp.]